MRLRQTAPAALSPGLAAQVDTLLLGDDDDRVVGHAATFVPAVCRSIGYRELTNTTRFIDHDGAWKELVFRGGMVAELGSRRWPGRPIDLRGSGV
ncbi:MAG: hypothetical protein J0J01_14110 [Reyranella sp.]|uniref:hypothetical protein n=1 Tax=Reyranella sp. TaxID=1929291 RepID=UPI001AC9B9EF|nr:hypothetical protein [Reyranella sp.]MBN9088041.1 hypothetical protein [Reyranella sp.]